MAQFIEITTKFCHPYMNFGGDENGCSDVVLKVPQAEAVKLQSAEQSKSEAVGEIQYYPEVFAAAFSVTIAFWLIAKFGWLILETIRRA